MRFIALILAGLCLLVGILQIIVGTEPFLLINTVKFSEPWRLVTSIFAHGSLAHFLSNIIALLLFGLILEGRVGSRNTFWLFMISGVLINVFSPYSRSLGASGAIFALMGSLIILRPLMVIWAGGMPMPMILAGVLWLAKDLLGIWIPDGVANLAHIGGLIIGLAVGLYWRKQYGDILSLRRQKHDPMLERRLDEWENRNM